MKVMLFKEELIEALIGHIKHKYDIDINDESITDMVMQYTIREHAFEKYKNGQFKKNEHGHKIIDWPKGKWLYKFASLDQDCEISFHINE